MANIKIFGSPTSSEVARVLTCLFEKDVEFQLIRVDTYRGPKRMPEYLKLQVCFCFIILFLFLIKTTKKFNFVYRIFQYLSFVCVITSSSIDNIRNLLSNKAFRICSYRIIE